MRVQGGGPPKRSKLASSERASPGGEFIQSSGEGVLPFCGAAGFQPPLAETPTAGGGSKWWEELPLDCAFLLQQQEEQLRCFEETVGVTREPERLLLDESLTGWS